MRLLSELIGGTSTDVDVMRLVFEGKIVQD